MSQFQLFYEEFKEEIQLVGLTSGFHWSGLPRQCRRVVAGVGRDLFGRPDRRRQRPPQVRCDCHAETVFISSDGTIMEKSVGAIDANFLARASRELLAAEAAAGAEHGG